MTIFETAKARQKALEDIRKFRKESEKELLSGTSDLFAAVLRYERELIRHALRAANKHPKEAARLLGLNHQTLCDMINNRHKELLPERTVVYRRKRSGNLN